MRKCSEEINDLEVAKPLVVCTIGSKRFNPWHVPSFSPFISARANLLIVSVATMKWVIPNSVNMQVI